MAFHIDDGMILDSDRKMVGEIEKGQFVRIVNEIGNSYEGWYDGEDGGSPVLMMCSVTTPDGEMAINMDRSVRVPHSIILVQTCEQTFTTEYATKWLNEIRERIAGGVGPDRRRD